MEKRKQVKTIEGGIEQQVWTKVMQNKELPEKETGLENRQLNLVKLGDFLLKATMKKRGRRRQRANVREP